MTTEYNENAVAIQTAVGIATQANSDPTACSQSQLLLIRRANLDQTESGPYGGTMPNCSGYCALTH